MEYGHLVVRGKTIAETDVNSFVSSDDIFSWKGEMWDAFNDAYPHIPQDKGPQLDVELLGKELADKFSARYLELTEIEQNAKPVMVDGVEYKRLKTIDVYYSGWECDSKAFLVETESGNRLVMTDHGHAHFAGPQSLKNKIDEYQDAIKNTQDLLALITS